MEYIAAPWREAYIRNASKETGCVFCRAARTKDDPAALVLDRGRGAFVLMNKYPYLPGHLMIAPDRHTARFDRASAELTAEMTALLQRSLRVLRAHYRPQGFNTGMNLGRAAGAGVVDHFHLHVVPRWTGDSNFMPVIGRTKVVLEDLDATFARLAPLFRKDRKLHPPTP
jgi:ATP adenylyltransferase